MVSNAQLVFASVYATDDGWSFVVEKSGSRRIRRQKAMQACILRHQGLFRAHNFLLAAMIIVDWPKFRDRCLRAELSLSVL